MVANQIEGKSPATRQRYRIVAWLLIGGIINYVDRSALSIAAPAMIKDLGFSMTQLGLIGSVFAWCYAIAQIPTGWLSDRISARVIFAVALIMWSLATMMTGLASALWFILFCRAILGIFEAPAWPVATKVISIWYPKQERGVAIGIFTSAAKWGPAIAPPILVAVMLHFGWRGVFVVAGAAGVIFGTLFYIFYRNPDQSKKISSSELEYIKAGGGGVEHTIGNSNTKISWGSLFSYRSVWGLVLGYFCAIWIWNIFIVFIPSYLLHEYNISIMKMGVYASVPWLGGALGSICSGFVAKWFATRFNLSPLKSNQRLVSIYAVLAACSLIAIAYINHLEVVIALMTFTLVFVSAINSSAWSMASLVAPPSLVSSVSSIQNFGGYFGGAFSPLVTGFIVDYTGSYMMAFFSAGIVAIGAAVSYLWIVKKPLEDEDKTNEVMKEART
jgi:sugar phosphate permease